MINGVTEFNDLNIKTKLKEEFFRNGLIKTLSSSIISLEMKSKFEGELNYIFDNRLDIFDNLPNLNLDDDKLEDLIIPCIRRAWSLVFINPPTLYTRSRNDLRLELFKLLWDVDQFLDYLVDILPKSINNLDIFENIDRASEILNLISQNYVNGLISKCSNKTIEELTIEIRDLKIKNTLK